MTTVRDALLRLDEAKRPRSVRGWLLWYIDQRSRRMVRAQNLDTTGGRASDEKRAQSALEYVTVTRCLVAYDAAIDLDGQVFGSDAQALERFERLMEWLSTSAEVGQAGGELIASNAAHRRQAADLGMGLEAAQRYFGYVEGVLRRRMKERGLIVEEEETWSVP